jgi:hypothetical protein
MEGPRFSVCWYNECGLLMNWMKEWSGGEGDGCFRIWSAVNETEQRHIEHCALWQFWTSKVQWIISSLVSLSASALAMIRENETIAWIRTVGRSQSAADIDWWKFWKRKSANLYSERHYSELPQFMTNYERRYALAGWNVGYILKFYVRFQLPRLM